MWEEAEQLSAGPSSLGQGLTWASRLQGEDQKTD